MGGAALGHLQVVDPGQLAVPAALARSLPGFADVSRTQ